MTMLLSKDTGLTDWVRGTQRGESHPRDNLVEVHMLEISKVKMRTALMPQSQIQGAGAGSLGHLWLLGYNDITIKVPNVLHIYSGSETLLSTIDKGNSIILYGHRIVLQSSKVE
jgi:hypothetical protein